MTRKERYDKILAYFAEQMPEVTTELEYGNAFQLLVAVILSAQCTDFMTRRAGSESPP